METTGLSEKKSDEVRVMLGSYVWRECVRDRGREFKHKQSTNNLAGREISPLTYFVLRVQYAASIPALAPLAPRPEVVKRRMSVFVASETHPPQTPLANQMAKKLPRPTISCTKSYNQQFKINTSVVEI